MAKNKDKEIAQEVIDEAIEEIAKEDNDTSDEKSNDDTLKQIEALTAQNEALTAENEALKDTARKIQAEFDNFRKRTAASSLETQDKGVMQTIKQILPVIDSIERATDMYSKDETKKELEQGFLQIHKQFIDILSAIGVKQMDCLEKDFDPNFHEAMMKQPVEGVESGKIVTVYTNGYILNKKVIRHAQVIVCE